MRTLRLKRLMRSGLAFLATVSLMILSSFLPSYGQNSSNGVAVIARYCLPEISLKVSQEQSGLNAIVDDRGIKLGGLFSDLYHQPGDPANVFYATADRGPNGEVEVNGADRRTFPVPEYSPVIYKITAANNQIELSEGIAIKTQAGKPVTGLSNTANDEPPYSFDAQTELPLNPNGLDVEGLARAQDGTYWIADEYTPSVAHIAADGKILQRLIPDGVTLNADTEVLPVLPAIYAKRRSNRGFEGLTISSAGDRAYVVLQSPLDFPNKDVGRASRMMRLLVIDTNTLEPTAEYVYVAEPANAFKETKQGELKLSGVAFINPTALLVDERTDPIAHIYQIDLSNATNILGSRWDDPKNTAQALESLTVEQLSANGITPVSKTLLVNLSELPAIPEKIEGIAVIDSTTIAVGNDNDFGFTGFDASGQAINNNLASELIVLRLPQPLP